VGAPVIGLTGIPATGYLKATSLSEVMQFPRHLKMKLVSEVQKTDPALAQALEAGEETYDGQTFVITLKHLVSEQQLSKIKEAATRVGIRGLGIHLITP
jgi:hypothetical protein